MGQDPFLKREENLCAEGKEGSSWHQLANLLQHSTRLGPSDQEAMDCNEDGRAVLP